MRVSDKMLQTQVMNNLNKNRTELSNLQNQAASLKQVTKPSDDPTGTAKILQNRTENKTLEQIDKNIFYGKAFLETTESTLSQLGEAVVRAKELAIQAANDTNGGLPREMIASEVEQIYGSLVEMSNRRFGDRFIFSGYKTTQAPFDTSGKYAGDDGQIQVQTLTGQFLPINLIGSQVFLGQDLSYGGAVNRDMKIPQSVEELQTYKLNQIEKEFEKENLQENTIETRAPASLGGVQRVGGTAASERDPVSGPRGVNIFQAISGLEASLRADDKLGIQQSLESLDEALNQVNLARAEVGGRVNQLNANNEGIQRSIIDNKTYNSQIEDADVFKVMTDLTKSNQTLEATLQTSTKFMNQSLLDFLR